MSVDATTCCGKLSLKFGLASCAVLPFVALIIAVVVIVLCVPELPIRYYTRNDCV